MSAPDGERAAGRRRGSWARTLERFRTVLRRKDSAKEGAVTPLPTPTLTNRASLSAIFDPPTLSTTSALDSNTLPAASQDVSGTRTTHDATDITPDEPTHGEEPLLPSNLGLRTGLSDEKAKILFEKYGLKYQAGKPAVETSTTRAQRVEKPIRIRIHWRCHECRVAFGQDRTCASCGHRRCSECIREPPKRIIQLLENARPSREAVVAGSSVADATIASDTQTTPAQADKRPAEAADSAGLLVRPLEQDDHEERDAAEPSTFLYSFEARTQPGTGMRLVHRPKAQIVRRMCHECSTPVLPASRADCQKCGHVQCTLCPRWPSKSGKYATPTSSDAQAKPAVATVERVYRKPRQRVRWTCDKCQALFAERDRCGRCNHERCADCVRSPPKKERPGPDPAVHRSVQDKLAAFAARHEHSLSVAVPS